MHLEHPGAPGRRLQRGLDRGSDRAHVEVDHLRIYPPHQVTHVPLRERVHRDPKGERKRHAVHRDRGRPTMARPVTPRALRDLTPPASCDLAPPALRDLTPPASPHLDQPVAGQEFHGPAGTTGGGHRRRDDCHLVPARGLRE